MQPLRRPWRYPVSTSTTSTLCMSAKTQLPPDMAPLTPCQRHPLRGARSPRSPGAHWVPVHGLYTAGPPAAREGQEQRGASALGTATPPASPGTQGHPCVRAAAPATPCALAPQLPPGPAPLTLRSAAGEAPAGSDLRARGTPPALSRGALRGRGLPEPRPAAIVNRGAT